MRLLLIILLFPIFSCNSIQEHNQREEKELQSRILKLHDKVMPQMENIINKEHLLSKTLSSMPEFKRQHMAADTAALAARLTQAISHLQAVDHTMMDWMHNLDMNFENKSHEQIMNYLGEQFKTIKMVDFGMKSSFQEADAIIKEVK